MRHLGVPLLALLALLALAGPAIAAGPQGGHAAAAPTYRVDFVRVDVFNESINVTVAGERIAVAPFSNASVRLPNGTYAFSVAPGGQTGNFTVAGRNITVDVWAGWPPGLPPGTGAGPSYPWADAVTFLLLGIGFGALLFVAGMASQGWGGRRPEPPAPGPPVALLGVPLDPDQVVLRTCSVPGCPANSDKEPLYVVVYRGRVSAVCETDYRSRFRRGG